MFRIDYLFIVTSFTPIVLAASRRRCTINTKYCVYSKATSWWLWFRSWVKHNQRAYYFILFYFTRCRLEGTTCFGLPYRPSSGHKIYPRKLYSKFLSFSGPCIISIFLLIYFQRDATLHSLFIYGKRSTCFGWYLQPSSGAHITVFTVSGTC